MLDPPPYRRDPNDSIVKDDGTAGRRYEWSGVELIEADDVFSEFPSENIEPVAASISHEQAAPAPSSGNDERARGRLVRARIETRDCWERGRQTWGPPLANLRLRTGELASWLWIGACGIARRQSAYIVARRGSVLLVPAGSFLVGVAAGAAVVWMSGGSSAGTTTAGTAVPPHVTTERRTTPVRVPALPAATSTSARADQQRPHEASPASSLLASVPRPAYRGSLVVNSRPSGARVFLNGRGAGKTPLTLKNQSVGSRAVRIELDGYQTWTSAVQVVTNTSTSLRADLKPARDSLER